MNTPARQPPPDANALTRAERAPILTVETIVNNRKVVLDVMRTVMKKGVHYGVIPGTGDKPTLLKPGAELLCATFRIAIATTVEDFARDADAIRYRVRVSGVHGPTGIPLGEGIGECSSDEKKYKWCAPVNGKHFEETAADRRQVVWKRGYNNKPDYQVQQVRTNPDDVANTILKMAKKRAHVDFTLNTLAVSDLFAQDMEELAEELYNSGKAEEAGAEGSEPATEKGKSGSTAPKQKTKDKPATKAGETVVDPKTKPTAEEAASLRKRLDDVGVTERAAITRYKVASIEELTPQQCDDLVAWLAKINAPE